METKEMLAWVRFVATKFVSSTDGWRYTRNIDSLKHIRYSGDYTGYNVWYRRLKRAFDPRKLLGIDAFSKALQRKQSLKDRFISAFVWIYVSLWKDKNLPDGVLNGGNIITHWEEDGEYIAMMGPTVGVKVLDFLEAEPDNPHAQAIIAEMHRVHDMSWPTKEADK